MKLHSIQFLRGIAAILVVYTHSLQLQMEYSVSVQQNIFHLQNFGCIGVDLFFVVSGFIIMFVANKYSGANEGFYFLLKRFFRINPVYYIASLFFLVFLLIQNWITTGTPDVPFANILNSFSDTILIMPVSDHILSYKPIIVAGWTLGFEWLFYTIFFLLILIKVKNKLAWLIILIACLLTSGFLFNSSDYRFVFATNPIMLEFLLGAIIYWLHIRLKAVPFYIAFACLSTGIIGYLSLIVFGFGEVWSYIMVLTKRLSFERFLFFPGRAVSPVRG